VVRARQEKRIAASLLSEEGGPELVGGPAGVTATTIIAAIGEYEEYESLDKSAEAAVTLARDLDGKGYRVEHGLLGGGTSAELLDKLATAIGEVERDGTLILFWTGHGVREADGHYLVCRRSPKSGLSVTNAIPTAEIGTIVAKSRAANILLVIDTCYSGQGALDAVASYSKIFASTPPSEGRVVSVIASAHPLEKAREAIFMRAVRDVLLDPKAQRRWSDSDERIDALKIQQSVKALLDSQGHDVRIVPADIGEPRDFIPNPRFGKAVPADDVETGRRLSLALETRDHFELASRGIETGQVGWYFTGRRHILSALVDWLKSAKGGIAIVTGPPGAGKSAVVGRLSTLSRRAYREAADAEGLLATADHATLPPLGSIDVAVHAKGKTLDDCARAIAAALELPLANTVSVDRAELVAAVAGRGRGATIVLDALDEAANNQADPIARNLLVPLAALDGVRVLVGTRRSLDGAVIPENEDQHARLRDALGKEALIFDLAEEPETLKDIAAYVRAQIEAVGHGSSPDVALAADRVAQASEGSFLYGRIVARTLKESGSLEVTGLPRTALEAFAADLSARFPDDRKRVNDLLGALAWGLGAGLSRKVWPQVATALSDGDEYDDDDVAWILDHVGWHIVEASTPTAGIRQATYRLLHQAFVDYYREGRDAEVSNLLILDATTAGIAGAGWLAADGYLRRHASAHAAAAGQIGRLIEDPGYLAVAEPKLLAVDLLGFQDRFRRQDPRGKVIAGIYQRCLRRLVDSDPLERMAVIHMTAQIEAPDLADSLRPPVTAPWLCLWARCDVTSPHQILHQYEARVTGVALGGIGDRPVVASSSGSRVDVSDARTGDILHQLTLPEGEVRSVAWGEKAGRPLVAIAVGAQVRFWDPVTGNMVAGELQFESPVEAVVFTSVDGIPAVAASSDDSVRFHSLESGDEVREPLRVEAPIVALSSAMIGGRAKLGWLTASHWALLDVDGQGPEAVPDRALYACACIGISESGGEAVIAFGSLMSIDFLARDGNYAQTTLVGHQEIVTALALGPVDGRSMVVSGSKDGTVRLWSADAAEDLSLTLGRQLISPNRGADMLVVGRMRDVPVIIGMSFGKLRVWNAETGVAIPPKRSVASAIRHWLSNIRKKTYGGDERGFAFTLSAGRIGDTDMIAVGYSQGIIQLHDVRSLDAVSRIKVPGATWTPALQIRNAGAREILQFHGDDHRRPTRFIDPFDGSSLDEWIFDRARRALPDLRYVMAIESLGGRPVLVVVGDDWSVGVCDLENGDFVGPMFSPDIISELLLTEHQGCPVGLAIRLGEAPVLWDLHEGKRLGAPLEDVQTSDLGIADLLLGQVEGRLIVVNWQKDGTFHIWNHRGGPPIRTIRADVEIFSRVALDGDRLFFSGWRGMMAIRLAPPPD
jgi:WD40 repeat protein